MLMTEKKRFTIVGKEYLGYTQGYAYIIRDNSIVCDPHQWIQWSVWEDKEDVEDLCDLLNEQQDTITKQKEENRQLQQLLAEYRRTNKHLSELCADASKNGYLPPLED